MDRTTTAVGERQTGKGARGGNLARQLSVGLNKAAGQERLDRKAQAHAVTGLTTLDGALQDLTMELPR